MKKAKKKVILASSSPYCKELLSRLGIEFDCYSPNIDESAIVGEAPDNYVRRMSREKAAKIGESHKNSLIIASDQASICNQEILGKPGDHEGAIEQLQRISGQEVSFNTAVTLLSTGSSGCHDDSTTWIERFVVQFRPLNLAEIERYLMIDQPYDCAGSFKSEKLGIALCQSMRGDDPTALIGLPLISLAQHLREFGHQIP